MRQNHKVNLSLDRVKSLRREMRPSKSSMEREKGIFCVEQEGVKECGEEICLVRTDRTEVVFDVAAYMKYLRGKT